MLLNKRASDAVCACPKADIAASIMIIDTVFFMMICLFVWQLALFPYLLPPPEPPLLLYPPPLELERLPDDEPPL